MITINGWTKYLLGDVAPASSLHLPAPSSTVWNLSLEDIESTTGRILDRKTCRVDELGSSKCAFDSRHVLYSKLRPYLNKVVLPDAPGVGTSELIPMLPDSSRICREYLAYYLRSPSFIDFANANTRGANLPRIAMSELWGHEIPAPTSLDEQRRIVNRIKECLRRVEEIEANESLIEPECAALFPSILNQRFEELVSSAQITTLEYAAEIRGGQSLPKGTPSDHGEQSVLLVKVGDMNAEGNERKIATSREYFPASEAPRGLIPAGAVIFPKRGGAIATNKKRLLGRPSLLDPNLMAVVAKPQATRESYLYYWCQTLDLNDLSNGGVIPQLNRKDLAPLEIPLPELEVQDRIVADLEVSESVCSEIRKQFSEASQDRKHLRESILRKAFAGEL